MGLRIMMPYDTYRFLQIARVKSPPRSAAPTSKQPGLPARCQRWCMASPGRRERCAGHSRPLATDIGS
jgi:hypothetical protein